MTDCAVMRGHLGVSFSWKGSEMHLGPGPWTVLGDVGCDDGGTSPDAQACLQALPHLDSKQGLKASGNTVDAPVPRLPTLYHCCILKGVHTHRWGGEERRHPPPTTLISAPPTMICMTALSESVSAMAGPALAAGGPNNEAITELLVCSALAKIGGAPRLPGAASNNPPEAAL
ncbi:hypothetical protein P154DRAFT_575380 [Amniculicola lignicola CBS 123094]|uniref:Uncharacterized protein n=1 Tax=Amniculicola lignicola CBS 123094 TaxID=1392246 RepID=A0A6A5WPJ2_9PLEO|nr:hypothetical protein P154DRAFT_575380 [Amniculicola lignicola CBS 123094]